MSTELRSHLIRFVALLLLQVLILQRIVPAGEWTRLAEVFLYPLFVMRLPQSWHPALLVACGFAMGIQVDLFYDTPGVHAAAGTLSAFLRPAILRAISPRAGYDGKTALTRRSFGMGWFVSYSALFLAVHILAVQSFTVFTFYYIGEILLRAVLTWVVSFGILFLMDLVINPRQ